MRWADTTRASWATPNCVRICTACCMVSQSLLEPMTTPITGWPGVARGLGASGVARVLIVSGIVRGEVALGGRKKRDFGRQRGLAPVAGQPATGLRIIPPGQRAFAGKPVTTATNLLVPPTWQPEIWAKPEKHLASEKQKVPELCSFEAFCSSFRHLTANAITLSKQAIIDRTIKALCTEFDLKEVYVG